MPNVSLLNSARREVDVIKVTYIIIRLMRGAVIVVSLFLMYLGKLA